MSQDGIKLEDCPRCGNEAAKDFEEHVIYCTGCPLAVQDTTMKFSLLIIIWNGLSDSVRTQTNL